MLRQGWRAEVTLLLYRGLPGSSCRQQGSVSSSEQGDKGVTGSSSYWGWVLNSGWGLDGTRQNDSRELGTGLSSQLLWKLRQEDHKYQD